MNMLLDIKIEDTPQYRYQEWSSRIDSDYLEQVMKSVDSMVKNGKSECTYAWHHPKLGKRYVRCGGVCDKNFKNGIKLKGLEFLKNIEGCQMKKLPNNFYNRIMEAQFSLTIINPGTPDEVKRNVFKRINTGGVPLSPQEIRNALYGGRISSLLKKMSEMKSFKQATDLSLIHI